jgi:hypothetical protein
MLGLIHLSPSNVVVYPTNVGNRVPRPCRWMIRAGDPTTVTWAGTSSVTTAPAPITDHVPTWTPSATVAPAPIEQPSPIVTLPQIDAPGFTLT